MSETWKTVKSVVSDKEKVVLPLFNVVDENDSTQDKLAKAVSQIWGIEYGFLNSTMSSLVQQFAKVSCSPKSIRQKLMSDRLCGNGRRRQ
jgi:hypothetical protein